MTDPIAALHLELDFAAVEPQLPLVTGVWSTIKKLDEQARADKAAIPQYRQFLVRCIKNLKTDVDLTDKEVDEARETYRHRLIELSRHPNHRTVRQSPAPDCWI